METAMLHMFLLLLLRASPIKLKANGAIVWGHEYEGRGRICAGGKDRRGVAEVWRRLLGHSRRCRHACPNMPVLKTGLR